MRCLWSFLIALRHCWFFLMAIGSCEFPFVRFFATSEKEFSESYCNMKSESQNLFEKYSIAGIHWHFADSVFCRHFSLSILALRCVGGCGHRWPFAHKTRQTGLYAFRGTQRILERSSGKGLCKVRSLLFLHSIVDFLHSFANFCLHNELLTAPYICTSFNSIDEIAEAERICNG